LLEFFDLHAQNSVISAMGVGKYGRQSRRQLLRRGSALNYAYLGSPQSEGQLSISEMQRDFRRLHRNGTARAAQT
jgi:3-dehydroquinate dehydratase